MSLLHKNTVARMLAGATNARRVLPADYERLAARWPLTGPGKAGKPFPIGIIWEWDIAGGCESPALLVQEGSEYRERGGKRAHVVFMETRCRQCPWCDKQTQAHWAMRGREEFAVAGGLRTWFGTLTFKPEVVAHYLLTVQARQYLDRVQSYTGPDIKVRSYEELPEEERVRLLANQAGQDVQRYLKRLRKGGAEFKYLAVPEAHKSGAPHFHLLLHERGAPIRHKTLKSQWSAQGFSDWSLANDADAVWYVCKYITKASLGRVRASEAYGQGNVLTT